MKIEGHLAAYDAIHYWVFMNGFRQSSNGSPVMIVDFLEAEATSRQRPFRKNTKETAAALRGQLPDPSRCFLTGDRITERVTLLHPTFGNREIRLSKEPSCSDPASLILTYFSFQVSKQRKRDRRVAKKVPLNPQQSSERSCVYSVYFVTPVFTETT